MLEAAAEQGFILEERLLAGRWVLGMASRGDDDRHPCLLIERDALDYMRDRLERTAVFE